jgi:hypothetical protein
MPSAKEGIYDTIAPSTALYKQLNLETWYREDSHCEDTQNQVSLPILTLDNLRQVFPPLHCLCADLKT